MKPLIKIYGYLISISLKSFTRDERVQYLDEYLKICHDYSDSEQKDFLRIAVIKSFKLSLNEILTYLPNFIFFLRFSKIVIRLLQDEIPEIRSKMAGFLSKIFKNETQKYQIKCNANYMLEKFFEFTFFKYFVITENKDAEMRKAFVYFILEYVFESEFDKYFEHAHFEKRIFAVEKPNKFYSTFIVRKIAFGLIPEMAVKETITAELIQSFFEEKKYKFVEIGEKTLEKYLKEPFSRDDVSYLRLLLDL